MRLFHRFPDVCIPITQKILFKFRFKPRNDLNTFIYERAPDLEQGSTVPRVVDNVLKGKCITSILSSFGDAFATFSH